MSDIRIDEAMWATAMAPEGIVERWFVDDGAFVAAGDPIVEVRIEGALHEIVSPSPGQLKIYTSANAVVEPGSVVASVKRG